MAIPKGLVSLAIGLAACGGNSGDIGRNFDPNDLVAAGGSAGAGSGGNGAQPELPEEGCFDVAVDAQAYLSAPTSAEILPRFMQRLGAREYEYTVADLLGTTSRSGQGIL
jgi:hypothetical protein